MANLRMGYSAANTAAVKAAGGEWDAYRSCYTVPDTATDIIELDQRAHANAARSADAARAKSRASVRTAGRIAGYSDAEVESALRTSGGDDL